jgi:Tfp pilus assembly protein PilF
MKTKLLILIFVTIAIALSSCKTKERPALTTDQTAIEALHTAGSYAVTVTSNATWTAIVNEQATEWCTLTNAAATGNGTVTVNVTANPTIAQRAATVTLTAGTLTCILTMTQAADNPTLSVDKTTIDAAKTANSYSIVVTSNTTWTVSKNTAATWCSLYKTSAIGNGTVTVNITANPVAIQRSATITFAAGTLTRTATVIQAAEALPTDDILSAEEYFKKGENARENRRHKIAIEYYQKAIEANPNYIKAYISMGDTYYFRLNNYPEAIRCYQKAIDLDPNYDAWTYYDMGRAYIHLENKNEAIRCFQKAAELGHDAAQKWLKNNERVSGEKAIINY